MVRPKCFICGKTLREGVIDPNLDQSKCKAYCSKKCMDEDGKDD